MRLRFHTAMILAGVFLFSCGKVAEQTAPPPAQPAAALPYDLTQPEEIIILTDSLREISGICAVDDHTVLSVQDELGIVFFLDLNTRKISRKISFGDEGDYEGVAAVKDSIYVLRSDGNIYAFPSGSGDPAIVTESQTHIPARESEGFCYDPLQQQLLIGCKTKLLGEEYPDKRGIFGFDPLNHNLSQQPSYLFDPQEINAFAEAHQIPLPKHYRKKDPMPKEEIRFRISGLAIHPFTDELYLLSAEDHLLFIFSRKEELRHIQPLAHGTFNKPEGITFLSSGEMLISNEAQDKRPTLLRFRYQRE